jgi:hypothetical protein
MIILSEKGDTYIDIEQIESVSPVCSLSGKVTTVIRFKSGHTKKIKQEKGSHYSFIKKLAGINEKREIFAPVY